MFELEEAVLANIPAVAGNGGTADEAGRGGELPGVCGFENR
jgi:hypothetical protein